jgi:hypothetical protein
MKKIYFIFFTFHFRWLAAALCIACSFFTPQYCKAQYTILHNFNDTAGSFPEGSLTLIGNKLYGITSAGNPTDEGCFFFMDTNGSNYTILHNFNGIDAGQPYADLTFSGNKLFATSPYGGSNVYGNIFSINTNGSEVKSLWSFGGAPNDGLPLNDVTISGTKFLEQSGGDLKQLQELRKQEVLVVTEQQQQQLNYIPHAA